MTFKTAHEFRTLLKADASHGGGQDIQNFLVFDRFYRRTYPEQATITKMMENGTYGALAPEGVKDDIQKT